MEGNPFANTVTPFKLLVYKSHFFLKIRISNICLFRFVLKVNLSHVVY